MPVIAALWVEPALGMSRDLAFFKNALSNRIPCFSCYRLLVGRAGWGNMIFASHLFRKLVLAAIYTGLLSGCLLGALLLRFDFEVPQEFWARLWRSFLWIIPVKLILLEVNGQFRSMLSYFSLPDAKRLLQAMAASAGVMLFVWYATGGDKMLPRAAILSDLILSFLALMALRTALRIYRERFKITEKKHAVRLQKSRRVVVIGAGSASSTLLMEILSKPGLGMEVVCFLDDDPRKAGTTLHGRRIVGPRNLLPEIVRDESITKAIIAMPGASPQIIKETVQMLNELGVEHDILPSVTQLLRRNVTVSHLRHVDPEDLLGRAPEVLDNVEIQKLIEEQVVMVTGAGGSIGSELCRQLAARRPAKLLLVERSEPALYAIEQELLRDFDVGVLEPLAVSVTDEPGLNRIFEIHKPSLVLHAAAHKHVPMMERQPAEAIQNNVIGSLLVSQCAQRHGVHRCILVSTDKAVNPTNVMGATKRVAELIWGACQQMESERGDRGTLFAAVRFGNVLGSSGSVIPTFRAQIANGGPVTVTHPEINRFFMSIPEAAGLILQSALLSRGGEVFVLDMGEPIRIQDLARQMIELCGFRPDEDIKIDFTGLRPGEKLYEEPVHQSENIQVTKHPKVRLLMNGARCDGGGVLSSVEGLKSRLNEMSKPELIEWLSLTVPEYEADVASERRR